MQRSAQKNFPRRDNFHDSQVRNERKTHEGYGKDPSINREK